MKMTSTSTSYNCVETRLFPFFPNSGICQMLSRNSPTLWQYIRFYVDMGVKKIQINLTVLCTTCTIDAIMKATITPWSNKANVVENDKFIK